MFTPAQIQTCKHFLNNTRHLFRCLNIFGGNIWFYRYIFRHEILPYLWINLAKYLDETLNMEVKGFDGDGYCFLNAVVKVLSINYNEDVTVEKAMQTVMKYLCSNFEKYMKYHCQREEDMEPTLADTLIADVIDFFTSQNFNMNVVDLLSQIMADVMHLNMFIYQNNNGQIQVYHVTGDDNPTRTVRLKFTHDNLYPQGNHYEAINKKRRKMYNHLHLIPKY